MQKLTLRVKILVEDQPYCLSHALFEYAAEWEGNEEGTVDAEDEEIVDVPGRDKLKMLTMTFSVFVNDDFPDPVNDFVAHLANCDENAQDTVEVLFSELLPNVNIWD